MTGGKAKKYNGKHYIHKFDHSGNQKDQLPSNNSQAWVEADEKQSKEKQEEDEMKRAINLPNAEGVNLLQNGK
nr:unnamed protein product [Callosobruchus analis]